MRNLSNHICIQSKEGKIFVVKIFGYYSHYSTLPTGIYMPYNYTFIGRESYFYRQENYSYKAPI